MADESADDPLWYKDAVIYQLHVRSFFDQNDDGIGDFAGLTSKLDYIERLGVSALWLLPFYPSPMRDDGYDIADYLGINPVYGTQREFAAFVRAAHERGQLDRRHHPKRPQAARVRRHEPHGKSRRVRHVRGYERAEVRGASRHPVECDAVARLVHAGRVERGQVVVLLDPVEVVHENTDSGVGDPGTESDDGDERG